MPGEKPFYSQFFFKSWLDKLSSGYLELTTAIVERRRRKVVAASLMVEPNSPNRPPVSQFIPRFSAPCSKLGSTSKKVAPNYAIYIDQRTTLTSLGISKYKLLLFDQEVCWTKTPFQKVDVQNVPWDLGLKSLKKKLFEARSRYASFMWQR